MQKNAETKLKKRTMIKDQVGQVRSTSYSLPSTTHTYGKACAEDSERAGAVLSKWVASVPSKPKQSQRSFVLSNQKALAEGCITAGSQRRYAQQHPDIRFKNVTGRKREPEKCKAAGPFGKGSVKSDSIVPIIEVKYTSFQGDEQDYPDLRNKNHKGRLPPAKATRASVGHDARYNQPEEAPKEPFKMKRFRNVPGRERSWERQSAAAADEDREAG